MNYASAGCVWPTMTAMLPPRADLTDMLLARSAGDESALGILTSLVYDEPHRLPQYYPGPSSAEASLPR